MAVLILLIRLLGCPEHPLGEFEALVAREPFLLYDQEYDCSGFTGRKHYASSRCGPHPVGGKAPNRFALNDVLASRSSSSAIAASLTTLRRRSGPPFLNGAVSGASAAHETVGLRKIVHAPT